NKIYIIRNKRVMIDRDLAELYCVDTRTLNQAVRRNILRFPEDFMFQLNNEEFQNWMSQIVISKKELMGLRKNPLVFTEQGVAMLSGILKSSHAINVNMAIMRAFVMIREYLESSKELSLKIRELEKSIIGQDEKIKLILQAIKDLITKNEDKKVTRRPIGY
ncbi:MAG: ORF6N domain-containing protein, partial [Bacteroidetes bacterium]|nr:ORF6N domain-containing protein [Bacteroidota bacterium]